MFLSPDVVDSWNYRGPRRPGGVLRYSDAVIEACLLIREYFGLGLRQTQGFVQSLCDALGLDCTAPDYTTLSRRCRYLDVQFPPLRSCPDGLVIAIDSTGLSVVSRHEWNRLKHQRSDYAWNKKWRKLHIAIDVKSGVIISGEYTEATINDGEVLPRLLESVTVPIAAVCGDMAYDKVRCRKAIHDKGARQLIPPQKNARLVAENPRLKSYASALKERDDAIHYIRHNTINGDHALAKAAWKEKTGYHARSRVECTMSQIKVHSSDKLTNRTELGRSQQALLKCKLINKLIAA